MPPFDGGIDGVQRKDAERFLDIICQSAKRIAESKATVIRSEHLCLFEPCLGV